MGHLTTHVLDTRSGVPAAGVRIEIYDAGTPTPLRALVTGADGRCAEPLLTASEMRVGRYVIKYYLAEYFRARGAELAEPAFIDVATIDVGIAHPQQNYHVPLLATPWSYSVYRGG